MKLMTFRTGDEARVGLVVADGVVDIGSRLKVDSLRALIASGRLAEAARFADAPPDHPLSGIKFLPVIPDPEHIFCVGANYADHLKEVQEAGIPRPNAAYPTVFVRFPETLTGHDEDLLKPHVSDSLDFEAELAVIIGTGGRYIDKEDALAHVAGYTCFNDGSVRDWQFHTSQVTLGKNFVRTGGLGPWMVTADEIPDPSGRDIALRLNGAVMQSSNTDHMTFDVPTIIAYLSAAVPLKPGDVIATGTPAGVGFSRKPPVFMKPGDRCEVEIGGIGVLRNFVAADE